MPNDFRHQRYPAAQPTAPYRLVSARAIEAGSDSEADRLRAVGDTFHAAGIARIYLVHGTFAGTDALGLFRRIGHIAPGSAAWLEATRKSTYDRFSRDSGNYTSEYASDFAHALSEASITVERFHWSSENHHLGRAHAAVRLCDALLDARREGLERALLWGHSHAGNVFALLTNILAASDTVRAGFFRAGRRADRGRWDRVASRIARGDAAPALDIVTFGTPIRYGWDTDACDSLLHFVHHRPAPEHAEYEARFPPKKNDIAKAAHGDCIHQFGIAGTNLPPSIFTFRTWRADRRIGRIVQSGVRGRDLLARLRAGVRVADAGETLLVDYGDISGHVGQHVAGHAEYTRRRWLAFHAEEVARRMTRATIPANGERPW